MHRVNVRPADLRPLVSAGCLLLLGCLAACSTEADTGRPETPPPSIGASPTDVPSEVPASPSDAPDAAVVNPARERTPAVPSHASDTERNRRAFATYVVSAYQHAIRTNDAGPLTAVAASDPDVRCVLCEGFADESRRLAGQDRYVPDLQITVDRVFLADRLDHGVLEYFVSTHASRAVERSRAGRAGRTYPANDSLVFDVGLRWHDGAYELTGLKAGV
jgi:hypothetical protein